MGIDYTGLRALAYAKSKGVQFEQTAIIGQQHLLVRKNTIHRVLKKLGDISETDLNLIAREKFAEQLFIFLGSKKVDSFDISDFEQATFLHDMNKPIESTRVNAYDLVYDGGTLEHVFNFPVAIKNCMEMVRPGGYFLSVTMANNFNGHGFYQFSPELFFRIFSPENGYIIDSIIICTGNTWYLVRDPNEMKSRVEFHNTVGTYLIVLAKKTATADIFAQSPFQSDYAQQWKTSDNHANATSANNTSRYTLERICRKLKSLYKKYFVRYDKKFFRKME
jgi:SAM-dependent methyltransferase